MNEAGESDSRERLMASAQRVFATHGFAAASVEKIASGAGLKKPTFFGHFASKGELYEHIVARASRTVFGSIHGALASTQTLEDAAVVVQRDCATDPTALNVLVRELLNQHATKTDVRAAVEEALRAIVARYRIDAHTALSFVGMNLLWWTRGEGRIAPVEHQRRVLR